MPEAFPVTVRDAAMLIVQLHMNRLKRFVKANKRFSFWNREQAYKDAIIEYLKLNPKLEKISRHTELNPDGECKGLVTKVINEL